MLYPGIAVEEMLVPAASTSEAPAVELPEMVEEAFWEEPMLELTVDAVAEDSEGPVLVLASVADSGEMPALLAVALRADVLLEAVGMRPVAGPVMPRAGLVKYSSDVGNDEEASTSVIVELGTPVDGAVLLREACDSGSEVDIGGAVDIQPEAWVW
jgi:hypothetical protein